MALMLTIVSITGSILLTPFLMLLVCIIFLASIGKSLGVRRLYVKTLLMIFEYGRKDIESSLKHRKKESLEDIDEGYSEEITSSEKLVNPPLTNGFVNGGRNNLISRDEGLIFVPEPPTTKTEEAIKEHKEKYKDFDLSNVFEYVKAGVEAIIEDQVTSRFEAEELKNWNLLIRTNRGYEFISWKLTFLWLGGFFIRYFFLFPLRLIICCFGIAILIISTFSMSILRGGSLKRWLNEKFYKMCFRILSQSVTAIITVHNKQWRPARGSVCVANHTSPIDIMILSTDNCYALIGQRHGGFLGIFQRALARASPHIWFERSETRDRSAVANRLREHVSNPKNPPILIFPEGTCINNTSVMQFKKGSFEVGSVIYPVAIKYDPRFGDAFWNSSRYSMVQYLYMMMTSWAIVCDVWYLPPMYQREDESAINFANRVKSVIAKQGGLVDLMWDGQLKRVKAKKEWKERQQEEFSRRLQAD
ncbi:glycerol-3-phosphate acyltransferase 3 isoform X1 [Diorhabda carinulata]|uniref:glycerol-3-phosphate acyltransferase 3 isoform X1 n=1 Tax=Diorhabda carinulata TaxID=1163345 RepID=UPI0025A16E35|nr:glycerol-3-phosphate acyltransferase 3 isoform X1 [Diorhabda carinulata]